MMNDGVKIDKVRKEELFVFFSKLMEDTKAAINLDLGFEFNINSHQQKKKVFSDLLGIKLETKKGKGTETCDAAAMLNYIEDYPLYRPFLILLLEYASLRVFTTNFLGMKLDDDDRARTQYKIAGTGTGRLASTKNIWGYGANFQNIPEKGKINLRYALEVMEDVEDSEVDYSDLYIEGEIVLPNVKKIFLADEGYEIADLDYSGADIMIVAADSECKWLLDFFANPKGKVYKYIASDFFQREITDNEYKTYKAIFHGTNYGLMAAKLATMGGISVRQAQQLQDFYYKLNPEVKVWQDRVKEDIFKKGFISNIFGREGWFLNRNDATLLNKALAFKPQSTIADLVNHGMDNIKRNYSEVKLKLQVHDSAVIQYPLIKNEFYRKACREAMEISLPFKTPITIPADIKVSSISYGDCSKIYK